MRLYNNGMEDLFCCDGLHIQVDLYSQLKVDVRGRVTVMVPDGGPSTSTST